jgi:acetylornithine/succinyldiaminopimelate/putrescine aminotransferase|tara:strand:+ start:245 stop:535 length:291 start_codon:yes stop_codon:yes gene_type:complete
MLIYGNTPKDIVKMMFRNKTKILLLAGAVVLAISLGTNKAVADEHDKTVLDTVKAVPTTVAGHVSNEITATKEYQAKSWAEAKAQWSALITKLSSK